jgi:hypothetical protein
VSGFAFRTIQLAVFSLPEIHSRAAVPRALAAVWICPADATVSLSICRFVKFSAGNGGELSFHFCSPFSNCSALVDATSKRLWPPAVKSVGSSEESRPIWRESLPAWKRGPAGLVRLEPCSENISLYCGTVNRGTRSSKAWIWGSRDG